MRGRPLGTPTFLPDGGGDPPVNSARALWAPLRRGSTAGYPGPEAGNMSMLDNNPTGGALNQITALLNQILGILGTL
jgi:hypothetical protein